MGNQCVRSDSHQIEKPPLQKQQSNNEDDFLQFEKLNENNTNQLQIGRDQTKLTIKDFQLLKVLGKGSFGKVMLVEHIQTKQLYAMKVLLKSQIKSEKQLRHTMTERIILELMENDFMVRLHYAFQSEHKLYLVVDYMAGGELFYYLRKHIRFSEETVRFFAAEILLALEYMHKNKIIYRDLKPENILLDQEGHVKLADFGLSKILEADDKAFSVCGTPEYLAPEIITSTANGYSSQCDWWSFGAVLYEMLTGAPPFYCNNRKEILRKIITYPVPMPEYLSDSAKKLLRGLLTIDPVKRLGYEKDSEEIKNMAYFKEIDFEILRAKQIKPPRQFQSEKEFKYFDPKLIKAIVQDTPVNHTANNQYDFTNFTYQKQSQEYNKFKEDQVVHEFVNEEFQDPEDKLE